MPDPALLTLSQARRARFHRLHGSMAALVAVVAGEKVVIGQGAPVTIAAGRFCLMPEDVPLTVENRPPPGGAYLAQALPLPRAVLEAAYARLPGLSRPQTPAEPLALDLPEPAAALFAAFAPAGEARRWPAEIRALRLEELALWAAQAGGVLPRAAPPRLSDRLRALIGGDPAADWSAPRAAAALAMSEATLRRKLAAEGAGFAEILRDLRLGHGLALLQTTDLAIARVAEAAGYASASQFAARFRARFGLSPREIRAPEAQDDRNAA